MTDTAANDPIELGQASNDGAHVVQMSEPFIVSLLLTGTSPILFHRWSNEAVAEKAAAAKGSAAKRDDNIESYVWRDNEGRIGLPGLYVVGSITDPRNGAAKYRQDPRSPRKSALDLYRAAVLPLTDIAPIRSIKSGSLASDWDYLDRRRVTVQRAGVTRTRPAFLAGWQAEVQLLVQTPEYVSPGDLHEVLTAAGRLVGVGDFRPTFGRFRIDRFDVGLE